MKLILLKAWIRYNCAVDGEIIDVNMTAVLNVERKGKVMPLVAIKNKLKWKWQIFIIALYVYTNSFKRWKSADANNQEIFISDDAIVHIMFSGDSYFSVTFENF